jgi:hypothetical protein
MYIAVKTIYWRKKSIEELENMWSVGTLSASNYRVVE